jgi:hypothetical protein
MVIEDESAATFLEAFDHVMLPIAVVDPTKVVCIFPFIGLSHKLLFVYLL